MRFRGASVVRITLELVVIYDFVLFPSVLSAPLGAKVIRFISLSLTKSDFNE